MNLTVATMGAPVNDRGCWLIENVYFDFDKSDIKSEFYPALVEIADVMKQNPGLTVRVEGHTDNLGTEEVQRRTQRQTGDGCHEILAESRHLRGSHLNRVLWLFHACGHE